MSLEETQLLIRRIKEGTVIDHIRAGEALRVLQILGITGKEGEIVSVAMNVPSSKIGKKDVLKVANRFLKIEETDKLALIAPQATVNIIKNYKVAEKRKVELPSVFKGLLKCPNPTCVSNLSHEPITPTIDVVDRETPLLKCRFCQRLITPNETVLI
ncbi:MAG TPA: aspartate carbamoyltransferase regulatory subunit [Nitrososphaerales archaeon]|nr:aspartate carbamoyltransferase regulatory subunit [Nitrososphaerales archaeon]